MNAAGSSDARIPATLEGMAFAKDVTINGVRKHTLYVGNDNDFLAVAPGGRTHPNQFPVFAFDDADLAGTEFVSRRAGFNPLSCCTQGAKEPTGQRPPYEAKAA